MKQLMGLLGPFCLLVLLATGCDTMRPLELDYQPKGVGPLTSKRPMTVSVEVEDERPQQERATVFQFVATGGTDSWYTKQPVPSIVQAALNAEVAKCHQQVVASPGAPSDVRVKVVLKRFRAFDSVSMFRNALEAEVDAEVSVTKDSTGVATPPFRISGNFERKSGAGLGHLVGKSEVEEALDAALAGFVHNLTFDSRFVEGFQ